MKRKALITSTAVLLVAIMCLATASYAWFTAGTASVVTELNVSITAGDTGLFIAPADVTGTAPSYAQGVFTTEAITDDLTDVSFISSTLIPVSSNVKANANGAYDFYEANSSTFDGSTWDVTAVNTTKETAAPGYNLFSFYVKKEAGDAKTYTLNFTDTFATAAKSTIKIAYSVVPTTVNEDGSVAEVKPGNLTIYAPNGATASSYDPVVKEGTDAITKSGSAFVATSGNEAVLDATTTVDTTWANPSLEFDEGADACLVTVAVWLEGQDPECSGSLTIDAETLALTIA